MREEDDENRTLTPQDKYMAGVPVDDCEGVKPLTVPDPSPKLELLLDIERALHTLDSEEQQIVRWRYWDDLPLDRIAVLIDVSPTTLDVRWRGIREKLQVRLAVYAPVPDGKMSLGSFVTDL